MNRRTALLSVAALLASAVAYFAWPSHASRGPGIAVAGSPALRDAPPIPSPARTAAGSGAGAAHGPAAACDDAHDGPEPEASLTPADGARVAKGLASLLERLGAAPRDAASLDSLREDLTALLQTGRLGAAELAGHVGAIQDPLVLDVVLGCLAEFTPARDDPAVLAAALALGNGADPARRHAGLLLLGRLGDPDGHALALLSMVARDAAAGSSRLAALAALRDAGALSAERRTAVEPILVALVASSDAAAVRAQAITALDAHAASPQAVQALGRAAEPAAPLEVRLAAIEALGQAGPRTRGDSLAILAAAYGSEPEPGARCVILQSLVRVGRERALPILERLVEADPELALHRDDYRAILAGGEFDLVHIQAAKAEREAARSRAAGPRRR